MFHTPMADIALDKGGREYLLTSVSLVSDDFDCTAPRCYLNDHNEAVPFAETGLTQADVELLHRSGVEI